MAPAAMTEAEWIDKFVMTLGRLCEQAKPGSVTPEQLTELARESYIDFGMMDPVAFARAEFDAWPPFDD